MSIADVINGTGAAGNASQSSGTKKKDQLGQNEFLQLMLAQLKNQDPFKAMDPSQFLGQLAQFGTVTGIQEMQTAFGTLSDAMRSSQVLDGSTMVGREVLVANGTTALSLDIRDANGTLVRHVALPAATGLQEFSWDGTADNGARAPAGNYTFEAIASGGGRSESLEMLLASRVTSVTIDPGSGLTLNTQDLGSRALSDVRRVM
jgi:flagellar basal-body rod modification protein FlgD